MNAKRAAHRSERYKKILDKISKRKLIKYLNAHIKYATTEGKTFVRTFIEKDDPRWKHSPYVEEYFEAKGYHYSCELIEHLDNDYRITIKWGEKDEDI